MGSEPVHYVLRVESKETHTASVSVWVQNLFITSYSGEQEDPDCQCIYMGSEPGNSF